MNDETQKITFACIDDGEEFTLSASKLAALQAFMSPGVRSYVQAKCADHPTSAYFSTHRVILDGLHGAARRYANGNAPDQEFIDWVTDAKPLPTIDSIPVEPDPPPTQQDPDVIVKTGKGSSVSFREGAIWIWQGQR